MSEICRKERRYIEELERELRKCSLEIGHLQDQLNIRNGDLNCMGEHAHGLELKLVDVGLLHEKLRLLNKALVQSDSMQLSLIQEMRNKDEEFHNSALESHCEIESMKLEIAALEERCFEAERISHQAIREKEETDLLLEMLESRFQDAEERISCLEIENEDLKHRLAVFDAKDLKPKETSTGEDAYCSFDSTNTALTSKDNATDEEMKVMSNHIHERETQILLLKEELKAEKLKAKDEAEDLIQEMAELRYQMTNMLEEECKRRASIEQTSLRRIQDLEEQVCIERNKYSTAIKRFQEAKKQMETQSLEIMQLKNAIEEFRKITDPKFYQHIISHTTSNKSNSYSKDSLCAEDTDDECERYASNQTLIGWYSNDEAPLSQTRT